MNLNKDTQVPIIKAKVKLCNGRKKKKLLAKFDKDCSKKDGVHTQCKVCRSISNKKYNLTHKAEISTKNKKHRLLHRNKINARKRAYYLNHKEVQKKYRKKHRAERNQQVREQRRNNIAVGVAHRISVSINRSLKNNKNGRRWEDLVGYTLKDLIRRLKATLPDGYSWGDYINGSKLHIDHKIPRSAFNITSHDCTDSRRCWALKNLRLLPAKENMSKSNKIEKPFQLCFTGL